MRLGRRTQVVKGAVCKTAMQRFDPARRLHTAFVRGLFGLFRLFGWLIETNQMNQINQTNKTNQINHPVPLPVAYCSLRAYARLWEKSIRHVFILQIGLIGA
jgi:hypothetical protein